MSGLSGSPRTRALDARATDANRSGAQEERVPAAAILPAIVTVEERGLQQVFPRGDFGMFGDPVPSSNPIRLEAAAGDQIR